MADSSTTNDRPVEDILDTIGDPSARTVLAAISQQSRSVKELANDLDISRTTVYRRIQDLHEYDLVTAKTLVAEDGNHYKRYECNFNSSVISLENDEYDVRIFRQENLPDRFSQLWDDLHR